MEINEGNYRRFVNPDDDNIREERMFFECGFSFSEVYEGILNGVQGAYLSLRKMIQDMDR